jgi:hypothetical protein
MRSPPPSAPARAQFPLAAQLIDAHLHAAAMQAVWLLRRSHATYCACDLCLRIDSLLAIGALVETYARQERCRSPKEWQEARS